MPGIDGIEATRDIVAAAATIQGTDPDHLRPRRVRLRRPARRRQRLPAQGHPARRLVAAIRTSPPATRSSGLTSTRRLIHQFATAQPAGPSGGPHAAQIREALTVREHDVFTHIAACVSNGEIAACLHLSEGTVKIHVGRILAKLGLRDRVQAVVLAYESRLIIPGTDPPDRPAHT